MLAGAGGADRAKENKPGAHHPWRQCHSDRGPGSGALGGHGAHGSRGLTGPQPRLGITGPQPTLNGGHNGYNGPSSYNGPNGTNGYSPTVTWTTPPGGGYPLPDDEDGDLL